ncbi:hypothetical protein TNIN_259701 [Trichonephila inaurata madagascariensis]|uniref:Uncharacterized protein n=1 Tax=Trichonephila inaurata madagascariensis TaxID=2747483 RepID=A0A8X6WYB4_9ARAC|nr:hypothetical protein TNIN_259701 [Trichonephila inaurata madagascariensis]
MFFRFPHCRDWNWVYKLGPWTVDGYQLVDHLHSPTIMLMFLLFLTVWSVSEVSEGSTLLDPKRIMKRGDIRVCGRMLTDTLSLLCNGEYYDPSEDRAGKRDLPPAILGEFDFIHTRVGWVLPFPQGHEVKKVPRAASTSYPHPKCINDTSRESWMSAAEKRAPCPLSSLTADASTRESTLDTMDWNWTLDFDLVSSH